MKLAQQNLLRSGNIPEDVGLLPDTFVPPPLGSKKWNWDLIKRRLKIGAKDLLGCAYFRFLAFRPRVRLDLFKVSGIARDLHERMYVAFASGNLESEEGILLEGIKGSLERRIALREPNSYLKWHIVKHIDSPRLVSFKATPIPGPDGSVSNAKSGVMQAVVRIGTVQSLQTMKRTQKREGNKMAMVEEPIKGQGTALEKTSTEYMVVQKSIRQGKEKGWKIWGFTQETSLK